MLIYKELVYVRIYDTLIYKIYISIIHFLIQYFFILIFNHVRLTFKLFHLQSWCWDSGVCNSITAFRNFKPDDFIGRSGRTFWLGVIHSNFGVSFAKDRCRLVLFDGTPVILFERILELRK